MHSDRPTQLARTLAWGAGAVDLGAGGAMVFAPEWALSRVQLVVPAPDGVVFVRFLGAMVAAVGACYLFGVIGHGRHRLRPMLAMTILFRVAAGTFALAAVVAGWLQWPWLAVAVVDSGLVAAQAVLLRKGAGAYA